MSKWTKWTTSDLHFLQDNCNDMTSIELAERLGVNVNRVQSKLWEMGLKAKRAKPTHTPRPAQKKVIDEAVDIQNATKEMHKAMSALDSRATILGVQAELLETMRALTSGKIEPAQAFAALSIGRYLIESAENASPSADASGVSTGDPIVERKQHKPRKGHPWRELDEPAEKQSSKPTGTIAGIVFPAGDFVPPAIGRVTKVVDGVCQ